MKKTFPQIKKPTFGWSFTEGLMDDSRVALMTLLTCTQDNYVDGMKAANIANYVELINFNKDKDGKIISAELLDKISNNKFTIKSKVFVNCAGPFSDNIRRLADPEIKNRLVGSRGVHLVLEKKFTPKVYGMLIPKTVDGRIMFVLPFHNLTLAGTTDHEDIIVEGPKSPKEDIDEISKSLAQYFNFNSQENILASFCGIRPLVLENKDDKPSHLKKLIPTFRSSKKMESKSLTRSHEVEVNEKSGLISLLGGKWTTYRSMGEDTVNRIIKEYPELKPLHKESITNTFKLLGSYSSKAIDKTEVSNCEFVEPYIRFLMNKYNISLESASVLVKMYGVESARVAELGKSMNLLGLITDGLPFLKVQVIYAIRNELAIHLKDVIHRRLGISFLDTKKAEESCKEISNIMKSELKWSEEVKIQEEKDCLETMESKF